MKRFGIIFGSYLAACFAASFVVLMGITLMNESYEIGHIDIISYISILGIGAGLAFISALIPAGAFIIYCELTGRPGWKVHALAGALSGFMVSTVYALILVTNNGDSSIRLIAAIIILPSFAGSVGAIVYWKMAVARWQDKLKPEQMVDVF